MTQIESDEVRDSITLKRNRLGDESLNIQCLYEICLNLIEKFISNF